MLTIMGEWEPSLFWKPNLSNFKLEKHLFILHAIQNKNLVNLNKIWDRLWHNIMKLEIVNGFI